MKKARSIPLSRRAAERYRLSGVDLESEPKRAIALAISRTDSGDLRESSLGAGDLGAGDLGAALALAKLLAAELERLGLPDESSLEALERKLGQKGLETLLAALETEFVVATGDPQDACSRLRLLLLVFWLNHNPAMARARRLFDDLGLARLAPYREAIELLLSGGSAEKPGTGQASKTPLALSPSESSGAEEKTATPAKPGRADSPETAETLESPQTRARSKARSGARATSTGRPTQLSCAIFSKDRFVHPRDRSRASSRRRSSSGRGGSPTTVRFAPSTSWRRSARASRTAPPRLTRPQAIHPISSVSSRPPATGPWAPIWLARKAGDARSTCRGRTVARRSAWKDPGCAISYCRRSTPTSGSINCVRRRGESVSRLDQIPPAELERLVDEGVTALWLIGVWERSAASRAIKHMAGERGAAASAYSIDDYRIAEDLGGDEAMATLLERAGACGLRVAVDVVPNHVGIDSRWVREHPSWLLAVETCPFPDYDFETPDLSSDPEIGLFLERGYFDRTDAAVVFRRLDRRTGREMFVYHGNDGSGLPWNDTAQLDYTNAEMRSAMLELILAQARRFPILRFDAAMTLTNLHFQRLWFPEPGAGGDIPSRSDFGCSSERFERLVPEEFWLQVTGRVAEEDLDVLLIAEAFWLMEPFFVRDLNMHRVYNSSFMHQLGRRETERFRQWLELTVATDPGFLERSVFYATNPDEQPAVVQFGRGERYFGVMGLLAVLPATPLLGHGQIEGLSEKYGMEYVHPLSGEEVDEGMRERHDAQIAPLLRLRQQMGAATTTVLRLIDESDEVASDVLAVLRGSGARSILVAFNNSERPVRGHLVTGPGLVGLNQILDEAEPDDLASLMSREIESAEANWHARGGRTDAEPRGCALLEALLGEKASGMTFESAESLCWMELWSGARGRQALVGVLQSGLAVELEPEQSVVLSEFCVEGSSREQRDSGLPVCFDPEADS